jgi:hypothetical protein
MLSRGLQLHVASQETRPRQSLNPLTPHDLAWAPLPPTRPVPDAKTSPPA